MKQLLGVIVAFYASCAFAGPSTSGGGFAVVCRDPQLQQTIKSAELLDLYEANVEYKLTLGKSTGYADQDYVNARLRQYGPHVDFDINDERGHYYKYLSMMKFQDAQVTGSNDLGHSASPPAGCAIEQMAKFHDLKLTPYGWDATIDVNQPIWNALDSMNRAALIEHERWYLGEREANETDSQNARAVVAFSFADGAVPTYLGAKKSARICTTPEIPDPNDPYKTNGTEFLVDVLKDKAGHLFSRLYFGMIAGRSLIAQSVADLDQIGFKLSRGQVPVVLERHVNKTIRVPIRSQLRSDWEIEVKYITNKPVHFKLFQSGQQIGEDVVAECHHN
jgi:hypothetical protein